MNKKMVLAWALMALVLHGESAVSPTAALSVKDAIAKGLYFKRDFEGGQMSRDMTLFVDDDGKAYHIYSAEENLTLNIAELSDDYQSHSGRYVRVAPAGHNEAPAVFKRNGTYWMITSGCFSLIMRVNLPSIAG